MFVTPVQRMSKRQVLNLAQDKAKMAAMVDDVSTFLADVLCIRDDMTPRKPLVQLMHEEVRYLPSRQKMEEIRMMEDAYSFVASAHWLATDVRNAAMHSHDRNMDMAAFAAREIYYLDDVIVSSGVNPTRIPVGGFFFKLAREVYRHAARWLDELDRALCLAAGMERSEAATDAMQGAVDKLATAIARCAALETTDDSDDDLSARALDAMMAEEVRRNSAMSQVAVQADLRALETLLCLALRPRGEEARAAVAQPATIADLSKLVDSPPPELAGHWLFPEAHMEQLGRALADGMDAEVRVALVCFWSSNYGTEAAAAVTAALAELRQWSPSSRTAFPSLIRDAPGKKHASIPVPKMRFLRAPRRSIVHGGAVHKRGLDERGVRVVRIVQVVWELSAYGVFLPGVVAAEAVAAVALEDIITSRFACATIDKTRRTNNYGVRLGRCLGMMYDAEGDHVETIQKACCALSRFSCDELEVVFSTDGKILPVVCSALAARTREKMKCQVDAQYYSFAADALALALPLVEMRRRGLGIRASETTHPLVDLLLTAEKARSWDPLRGALRLEVSDLSAAHKKLRVALDALHEAGVLVKRTGGTEKSKRKIVYEFHCMTLRKLFESWVNEAVDKA